MVNDSPTKTNIFTNVFSAGFFTLHFGIFIIAFGAIAVFSEKIPGKLFDAQWIYPALLVLLVSFIIDLPFKLLGVRQSDVSLTKLMFVPYVRLFPFGAVFLATDELSSVWVFFLFIVLKLIVDLVYYRFMNIRPVETENT
jgi:hypothetical protein